MRVSRRIQRLIVIGVVAAIIIALIVLTVHFYRDFDSPAKIKTTVGRLGIYGPIGIIALQAVQIVIAPVPGSFITLASGYLFGPVAGTVHSMVGIIIGSGIVLVLSRLLGRRIILLFMRKETLAKWDGGFQKWSLHLIFLLYLVPNPLGDMINYLAGVTPWPIPTLLIVAALGRLPFSIVSAFIGYKAATLSAVEIILLAVGFIAVGVVYYLLRNRIEKMFLRKSG